MQVKLVERAKKNRHSGGSDLNERLGVPFYRVASSVLARSGEPENSAFCYRSAHRVLRPIPDAHRIAVAMPVNDAPCDISNAFGVVGVSFEPYFDLVNRAIPCAVTERGLGRQPLAAFVGNCGFVCSLEFLLLDDFAN